MKKSILTAFFIMLAGCNISQEHELSSSLPAVSYTGKGTQSGPMLMGAMGPVGIAIGIAIDQGIAKEIDEQIKLHQQAWNDKLVAALNKHFVSQSSYVISKVDILADRKNNDLAYAKVTIENETRHWCIQTASVELAQLKSTHEFWLTLYTGVEYKSLCNT